MIMNKMIVAVTYIGLLLCLLCTMSCTPGDKPGQTETYEKDTFGYDLDFLSKYQQTILLHDGDAMITVCPAYQGRVMTSSAGGKAGLSFGWINYDLISSGEIPKHIYPVGGEDRFWLGPEGGQFSIYFKPGASFTFEEWQTPAFIDTEPFDLISKTEKSALFEKQFELTNYSGTTLKAQVSRKISLIGHDVLQNLVDIPANVKYVAYQSDNKISNTGNEAWTETGGALSIWILGMFSPTDKTTVMVPYIEGSEDTLGPVVNDTYFGKVPADRLIIRDGLIYFKADGKYRSKIGLNPRRAKNYAASYDEQNKVLTLVFYNKPDASEAYVNSLWELQENPFSGDVINSYNDGPVNDAMMGPFYELETSSPAAFLAPGEAITHVHTTIHIMGNEEMLEPVIRQMFNTDLQTIKSIF